MQTDLLPCPFCGGRAEIYSATGRTPDEHGTLQGHWVADCTECNANIEPLRSPEHAIQTWNRRHRPLMIVKPDGESHPLAAKAAELERIAYVPGHHECETCGCYIVTTNIHPETGKFSAGTEPEECPNGHGPMMKVTERKAGNRLVDRNEALRAELQTLQTAHGLFLMGLAYYTSWPENESDAAHDRRQATRLFFYARNHIDAAYAGKCHEQARAFLTTTPEHQADMEKIKAWQADWQPKNSTAPE